MIDQQDWIALSFVDIATHLVDDFDVVDLLSTLAERCARFVDAAEVGFMLADAHGTLQVLGASSEKMQALELLELQSSEGPCVDSFATGEAIVNQDLHDIEDHWSSFVGPLRDAGIEMVHAFPMRLRSTPIGAMNVFHTTGRPLTEGEASITQAFADAATIAIMQDRALKHQTQLAEQLQHALDSRVVIEQAKGVLSERLQVDMEDAFAALRIYSRKHNQRLSHVAVQVIDTSVPTEAFAELLAVRRPPEK